MTGVIVHDWLEKNDKGGGGSVKVAARFAAMYPDAPIFTLWNDDHGRFPPERVTESWLAKSPLRNSKALSVPLMDAAWRTLPRLDAEWVLCSSHAFAHHARFAGAARGAPKFVYVHSPARYIWVPEIDRRGSSAAVRLASPPLRWLDRARAREAHSIAANSEFVRRRVQDTWRRDAEVIYPPTDVGRFAGAPRLTEADEELLDSLPDVFLLGASRFIEYKRLDLVITSGAAAGLPVVLAGEGPYETALRSMAEASSASVTFLTRPSDELLHALYQRALALVFPAIEDFGLMPVEAMAAGTPVIGRSAGGVAETVEDGVSGFLLNEFTPEELRTVIPRLSSLKKDSIIARAQRFGEDEFRAAIQNWIGF
ncbi:glycosyltransferase [Mycolicibacterium sp. F2034L]|uniref:glycosyltransferase n=1 Tax=Mycolicibacterium sp. F2034L TaxID=2926422 RepID=UPI001FF615C8|nr:glycosyltransferase [Mycolicibacterium sp. F2034L]MCK0173774.1 glycosyltransferase [Mycolicibacterium sp. F2034L]